MLTDESLESCPLTGPGLLLHGHDLQHLVLESGANKHVDDLVLFDGQGVEVDLLQTLDLAVLHQAAQLGHGDPLLVLLAAATSASPATTAASSTATSTASVTETSTKSFSVATSGWSTVRHSLCKAKYFSLDQHQDLGQVQRSAEVSWVTYEIEIFTKIIIITLSRYKLCL